MRQLRTPLLGRNVTVYGFGRREGVALVRFLVDEGAHVLVTDRLPAEQLGQSLDAIRGLPVDLNLGGHDEERILGFSQLICVSPVVPRTTPLLARASALGIPLSSEVELFFERCPVPIAGVTGSAGKTTTTTLIGEMLRVSGHPVFVGGNIGMPLTPELPSIGAPAKVVMELSSFQLQPMRQSPAVAVVTNVTPNHLDRHSSMDEYTEAKRQIVAHQSVGDIAILNAGDPLARSFAGHTPAQVQWFAGDEPALSDTSAWSANGALWVRHNGETMHLINHASIVLPGEHNRENALAAALAALAAGATVPAIRQVLTSFTGVEHRLQLVAEANAIRYYDDSIATAPERLLAGLRAMTGPVVLILGGRDKHLPWEDAAAAICRRCRVVVLTGEAAPMLERLLHHAAATTGSAPEIVPSEAFDGAVQRAIECARPGDQVLLSPGCTSFDQFIDFAARGTRFSDLVHQHLASSHANPTKGIVAR